MAPAYQQDMPPQQGYGNIAWQQVVKQKMRGRGKWQFAAFAGVTISAWIYHEWNYSKLKRDYMEEREFKIIMEPFLYAERGRALLKVLRTNRDEERELMKDVPNWKVGHYYDTPVYHKKRWMPVPLEEIFAHRPFKEYKRANLERIFHP